MILSPVLSQNVSARRPCATGRFGLVPPRPIVLVAISPALPQLGHDDHGEYHCVVRVSRTEPDRFGQHPEQPFAADLPYPHRRPLPASGDEVDRRATAYRYSCIDFASEAPSPRLLLRASQTDDQQIRRSFPHHPQHGRGSTSSHSKQRRGLYAPTTSTKGQFARITFSAFAARRRR